MTPDEFCEETVQIGSGEMTCDLYLEHDGPHGGVYPGTTRDGRMVDVHVRWTA
jgi:hypothetical protein